MNRSIDDLPTHILIDIISNLSSHLADYLPLKLVSSKWNYAIDCYFESIKHLVQRKLDEKGYLSWGCEVTKDGLIVGKSSNLLDQIISCMKLLPNLTAVSFDLSEYTKKDQNTLFTYLNTRPTITSLELFCVDDCTKLQNDVKLENIRNFALNAQMILSEYALSRLFQADHKLTQLYVYTDIDSEMPFEDGNLILKRMPTLRRFSQHLNFIHGAWDIYNDIDLLIYTKQPGLSFENLEFYSFHARSERADFLNYVDNFVACCPNLKSVDCWLRGRSDYMLSRLNNLRAHTSVENLAIYGVDSSWEFVSKVIEMFPMVKNLKLQDIKGVSHTQISQALLKLPNLSLLYLRRLDEFFKELWDQVIEKVDCEALKEEYNSKYGRNLQIIRRNGDFEFDEFPFRHGFNFMKNVFWSNCPPELFTD